MTLNEIKSAVAAIFGRNVSDLTVSGQDMFLVAVNQVRREAELLHDFEFSRKLVTLTVDGETGGSLDNAVIKGTATTVKVKTVVDLGLFDDDDNLRPSEWTTVSEGLERQRQDHHFLPRYPTDQDLRSGPCGPSSFQLAGTTIYKYPKSSTTDFAIGAEVYTFQEDWTAGDLTGNLTVTGTLNPDLTVTLAPFGTFGNYAAYWDEGLTAYLYHNGTSWILAEDLFNVTPTDYFGYTTLASSPAGSYTPAGAATGTATVTAAGDIEDYWTIYGHQFLIWGTVVFLNHMFKTFVYRQEGNLAPPEKLRDAGLAAFIEWDSAMFETNRRHSR